MISRVSRRLAVLSSTVVLMAGCAGGSLGSPTGLSGGQVSCPDGPRQTLDCRGVLQQFARDFKADINFMSKAQLSAAAATSKLIEADALSGDIIQHHYQTCSLYNACVISRQEFSAQMDKLHQIQLDVRRTLGFGSTTAVAAQQNIQITQPGAPLSSSGFPSPPQGDSFPPTPPGVYAPSPPGTSPAFPDPNQGAAVPQPGTDGLGNVQPTSPAPGVPLGTMNPPTSVGSPNNNVDAVLDLLRNGSKMFRDAGQRPVSQGPPPSAVAPQQDLDTSLGSMLTALKQNLASRQPALASGRAVIGNFTEQGQPYSGPLGALLQQRLNAIVQSEAIFKSAPVRQTRGITVQQVAGVQDPNNPKALGAIYGSDVAIAGTYRPQGDRINVQLTALDTNGTELAQVSQDIPAGAVPSVLATAPTNAADTNQLLTALNQLGPKTNGQARVDVTTNRPGAGAAFRLGEEIRFLVTATTNGYLYLFHIDAGKNVTRIFPNEYQPEAKIQAGAALEVPAAGAPFRFEASPPFGLETTLAFVTVSPLDERGLRDIGSGLQQPGTRGVSVKPVGGMAPADASSSGYVWNTVTVLITP
jgi:uncharacterized protein DUF4384